MAPNTLADLRESAIVAVRCQTSLLTAIPHFNFRSELLQSVVDRMDRNDSTGIGAACCAAIVEVFENDDQGELSLEAVKMISKMIKDRSFRVARNVLDTFLHVRLNAARRRDEPAAAPEQDRRPRKQQKSTKPHVSKFQKKMAKQQKEVERTLKEAEAEVATEDRAKQQTETLKHMFLAYFRVLRACREKTVSFWTNSMSMELVLSTLDGLSRYAHMIDVDFFLDLLATLKTMAAQASEVLRGEEGAETAGAGQTAAQRKAALLVSLRSTIAAIQILSGQGEALNIDLKDFSEALYGSIMDVCFLPNGETQEALALLFRGLDMFLLRRKEPSLDRVAAFTKRLVTASLQLGERGCGGCLALLRSVLLVRCLKNGDVSRRATHVSYYNRRNTLSYRQCWKQTTKWSAKDSICRTVPIRI